MVGGMRLLLIFIDSYPLPIFWRWSEARALFCCVGRSICFNAVEHSVVTSMIMVTMAAGDASKMAHDKNLLSVPSV